MVLKSLKFSISFLLQASFFCRCITVTMQTSFLHWVRELGRLFIIRGVLHPSNVPCSVLTVDTNLYIKLKLLYLAIKLHVNQEFWNVCVMIVKFFMTLNETVFLFFFLNLLQQRLRASSSRIDYWLHTADTTSGKWEFMRTHNYWSHTAVLLCSTWQMPLELVRNSLTSEIIIYYQW